ncbi:MAG: hypothetical protein HONBIEJF_01371 [Fimbriimonadaceae bacterium]|nr:hypothetical protein [Fimbriimonadaceae bacterium]
MQIYALILECRLVASSLKEKRRLVKRSLDHARSNHRLSARETDDFDLWGNTTLGFATIESTAFAIDALWDELCTWIESEGEMTISGEQRLAVDV